MTFCRAIVGIRSNLLTFLGHPDQAIEYIHLTIFDI